MTDESSVRKFASEVTAVLRHLSQECPRAMLWPLLGIKSQSEKKGAVIYESELAEIAARLAVLESETKDAISQCLKRQIASQRSEIQNVDRQIQDIQRECEAIRSALMKFSGPLAEGGEDQDASKINEKSS